MAINYCPICGVGYNKSPHHCTKRKLNKIDKEGHPEYQDLEKTFDTEENWPKNVEDVVDEIDSEND